MDLGSWFSRFPTVFPGGENAALPSYGERAWSLLTGTGPINTSTGVTFTPQDIDRGVNLGMAFSGGGLGTKPYFAGSLENLVPSDMRPPLPANDPAMINMQRPPNYEAAVRQQQIQQAANQGAHIGDIDYWQKIADAEGHKIGSSTNPYKAAKEVSRRGQDTIIIEPEGRRVLYQNGQRLAERYSDTPSSP